MKNGAGIAVRLLLGGAFAAAAFLPFPASAQDAAAPEPKIALVIGNGSYANVPLKNPVNDARDTAAALQKLGFSVTLLVDADFAAMNRAVRDFGTAIRRPNTVALFYYSGHGVQYRGANYLIPARSDIREADELTFSALNAELIYAKMESAGARTNIVILDACRNNPFPGSERASERGLAVVGNVQPPQSLIVYATAPGKTAQDGEGRNGVFTGALLKHLADPNLDVELMIRRVREDVMALTNGAQVPWHSSSISGAGFTFVSVPVEPAGQPGPAAPGASALPPASAAQTVTKTTGTLSISSDPPGAQVSIDDAAPVKTPVTVELAPGSHAFEVKKTYLDSTWYGGQARQWVAIAPGTTITVPLKLQALAASLAIRLVPQGYTVFVNDEKVGVTPLGEIRVRAGRMTVRFERPGEPPRTMSVAAAPDTTAVASWGLTRDTPVVLERRSIRMDGRADSWAGLEPVCEVRDPSRSSFMGQAGSGIARVYMCRDEKNLYWRVDFAGANPVRKVPRGVKKSLDCYLSIAFDSSSYLNLGTSWGSQWNGVASWMGTWNGKTSQWTPIGNNPLTFNNEESMLVQSVSWDKISKYCTGPAAFQIDLANSSDRGWEPGAIQTEPRFVDFSK